MTFESPQSESARFWAKVRMGDYCWEWCAYLNRGGYGTFFGARNHYTRVTWPAHRYSWIQMFGEIPNGLFVCHRCDNPKCVRPDHLFLGTPMDNCHDMMTKGRHRIGRRARGSQHYRAKLTELQVMEIRRRRAHGESGVELGREYGVASTQIYYIAKRRTWKSVPEMAA